MNVQLTQVLADITGGAGPASATPSSWLDFRSPGV